MGPSLRWGDELEGEGGILPVRITAVEGETLIGVPT